MEIYRLIMKVLVFVWSFKVQWKPLHSGLPQILEFYFLNKLWQFNWHGLKPWNPKFQKVLIITLQFMRVLVQACTLFYEINLHFDQFSKGHCCWTKHDNDPILFLNEPWHVKFWCVIGKTRKIWKTDWLILVYFTN